MRKIHFIILGFMVVSCGSGEEETKTNSDDSSSVAIVPVDTVVNPEIMYTDIDLDRLFAKAGSKDGNLFIIDSAYIANHAKADESSKLTGSEAKLLMSSIVEETAEWKVDEIADFIFFDSLRANEAVDEYLEAIDIGMTARSEGAIADLLEINDSTTLLLWVIDYNSYEACPYGWGIDLFGSLFVNDRFVNTALIAESSGGADAPVWGETLVTATINNGIIDQHQRDRYGDVDEEDNEIITMNYKDHQLKIVNGKLVRTFSDREKL